MSQPNAWNTIILNPTKGLPHLYHTIVYLLRELSFKLDPLRFFLVLNSVGLVLGLALTGQFLILAFWLSNLIFLFINYWAADSLLDQMGLRKIHDDNLSFIPSIGNYSFWKKKHSVNLYSGINLLDGEEYVCLAPDFNFRTLNKKSHLLESPNFALKQIESIDIIPSKAFKIKITNMAEEPNYSRCFSTELYQKITDDKFVLVIWPKSEIKKMPIALEGEDRFVLTDLKWKLEDNHPSKHFNF